MYPDYNPPSWYFLMVAAEEIGCTPWELEQQPVYWRDRALIKRAAESEAKIQKKQFNDMWEDSKK